MNTVEPIRDMELVWDIEEYLKSKSERNYVMFVFGIYSGLRISDILKLRVRDVRDKKHLYLREQKTDKEKRFRINDELKPVLNTYVKDKQDYEYLFARQGDVNHPITRQQAYKILNDAAQQFGLDNIGTHTLRKTFGYHTYKQTGDIAAIQEIMNHAHPSITLRYIGINQDRKDEIMNKLSYKKRR